jgi:hypothetical protein
LDFNTGLSFFKVLALLAEKHLLPLSLSVNRLKILNESKFGEGATFGFLTAFLFTFSVSTLSAGSPDGGLLLDGEVTLALTRGGGRMSEKNLTRGNGRDVVGEGRVIFSLILGKVSRQTLLEEQGTGRELAKVIPIITFLWVGKSDSGSMARTVSQSLMICGTGGCSAIRPSLNDRTSHVANLTSLWTTFLTISGLVAKPPCTLLNLAWDNRSSVGQASFNTGQFLSHRQLATINFILYYSTTYYGVFPKKICALQEMEFGWPLLI